MKWLMTAGGLAALCLGASFIRQAPMSIPDPKLTPGSVWTEHAAEACARPLPPRPSHLEWLLLKAEVMRQYGLPWAERDSVELDHLVPRELGGADVIANLWPERWPEAHRKDQIEDSMTRDFCRNDRSDDGLVALQHWFAAGKWSTK
jgi:hypothetical protein